MSTNTAPVISADVELDNFLAQFDVVKHVTLPVIQIPKDGRAIFIKIESKIEEAKEQGEPSTPQRKRIAKDKDGNPLKNPDGTPIYLEPAKRQMDPPMLCEAVNLRTGELGLIVVNATIQTNLEQKYPGDSYVGKMFQIRHLENKKSAQGFNYRTFEILELKPKAGAPAATKPAPATARK